MFSKNINTFSKNKTKFSIANYQKPACSKKAVKKVFGMTKQVVATQQSQNKQKQKEANDLIIKPVTIY